MQILKEIRPILPHSMLLPRAVTPWQGGLAQPLQAAQPALLRGTSVSAALSSHTEVESVGDQIPLYKQVTHFCCKRRACRNWPGGRWWMRTTVSASLCAVGQQPTHFFLHGPCGHAHLLCGGYTNSDASQQQHAATKWIPYISLL